MNSFFSNSQAKKEVEYLYQSKLDELAIVYEYQAIETSFGTTNIITTGQPNKPPLVLIHGSNCCAPIAIEALIGLLDHFSIYAIDVIGQPNLSAEIRPSMQNNDYGKWMFEILTRLNIWDATLVGISFGGFISWKTLLIDEKRILKAFLIVPAGIVNSNPLKAMRKVFLPIKLYKWLKETKYIHQFLGELFTEENKFALAYLSKVVLHFEMDFSPIPLITDREAQQIKTPINIIAADDDVLFPGEKMLKRASVIFPSMSGCVLLQNSKHVPGQEDHERIVQLITSELVL